MKKDHFIKFTEKHLGKEVVATVKFPKRVIKGKLIKVEDEYSIKNGTTIPINDQNLKTISVVINREERQKRRNERRMPMIMN
ncbi:MAG: hypothetical protein WCL18_04235 [bacterium]